MSNRYYPPAPPKSVQDDPSSRSMASLSPEIRAVLMGVDRSHLESSFAAIEAGFGSVDADLERELGVDARDRARLRQRLTERS